MIKSLVKYLLTFWVFLLIVQSSQSTTVETVISYVSGTSVYLSAGSAGGIQKGDSADVLRDGKAIARLEVIYVADNSSSARIIGGEQGLQVGDRVIVTVSAPSVQDSSKIGITPLLTGEAAYPPESGTSKTATSRLATRISGRIAAQVNVQSDHKISGNDVTKPALLLRATVENAFMNYLNLSVNLRTRKNVRSASGSSSHLSEWDNRVYELALQYNNPASSFNYQMGRIASNRFSGIGPFDGAMLEYRLQRGWSAGAFGGTRPDLITSSPTSDETTGGLFAAYEAGEWSGHRFTGTAALVGRYHTGTIDEEFLYEQVSYSWSRRLYVYQSAEIAINRDWRQQAEGSSVGLSNLLLNASYTISSKLSLDFGYDNRKLVHTFETKDTPDSLFDEALRQGFRAGVSAKLPLELRGWLRGGLSTRQTGETDTRTVSVGLNRNDFFSSGISASLQYNAFENRFSTGYQASLNLARYFFQVVYLQFDIGRSRYAFTTSENPVSYDWYDLNVSSNLTRCLYLSAFGELYRGDLMNTDRFGMELGYRF